MMRAVSVGVASLSVLLLACEPKKESPQTNEASQEEARRRNCPDLKTWTECDARIRASVAATASAIAVQQADELAEARNDVDNAWVDFDRQPKRDKAALLEKMEFTKIRIAMLKVPPSAALATLEERNRAHYRVRLGPLIQPPTRAVGQGYRTLVPHPDAGPCRLWGSMWMAGETADALESLGFEWVKCGAVAWNVKTRQKESVIVERGSPAPRSAAAPSVPAVTVSAVTVRPSSDTASALPSSSPAPNSSTPPAKSDPGY